MLRLLRPCVHRDAPFHACSCCLAAFSGVLRFSPNPRPMGDFRPGRKTSASAKSTGRKPSLTHFLLFMAGRAQALF
jgi:hypothetical protein